jgi:hypothetical protein
MHKPGFSKQTAIAIGCILLLIFSFFIYSRASSIGTSVGQAEGKLVGTAVGSAKGVTIGRQAGKEAGEQAGLSAQDTTVDIKSSVEALGNLEVLASDVTLSNRNKLGEAYASLSLISGQLVFFVDMSKCEVSFSRDSNEVYIILPAPQHRLSLDLNSTKLLAEIQHFSFSVDAEDAMNGYINSLNETADAAKEDIANYEALSDAAKDAAKNQVTLLVKKICGGNPIVNISFKESED